MKDILETLQALQDTPVPNLLVIAGFIFILLAFVGKIGAVVQLPKKRQKWAGIIGSLLLIFGIGLFMIPSDTIPPDTATVIPDTPTPEVPTNTPVPEPTDTPTPTNTPTATPTDIPTPTPTNTPTPTPVVIDTMDSISGWSMRSDTKSTIEIRSVRGTIDDAIEISYTLTATLTANSGNWVLISRPVNMQPLSGITKGIRFFCSGSGNYNTIELKLLYAPDPTTDQSVTFVKLWPAATVADWRSLQVLYTEFDCGETCPPNGQLNLGEVRTINFAISNAQGGGSGSGTVAIDHVVGIR